MENHAYTDHENNIQRVSESQLRDPLDRGKKAGVRNPESRIQKPESGIRNLETGIENDDRKIHFSNV